MNFLPNSNRQNGRSTGPVFRRTPTIWAHYHVHWWGTCYVPQKVKVVTAVKQLLVPLHNKDGMAALVWPQLEVPVQRHLVSESLVCALSQNMAFQAVHLSWNSQLYFGLYPMRMSSETFCPHLPELCQGPLKAGTTLPYYPAKPV